MVSPIRESTGSGAVLYGVGLSARGGSWRSGGLATPSRRGRSLRGIGGCGGRSRTRYGGSGSARRRWSCYEAGRDGFWVHRAGAWRATGGGSASIEVNRRHAARNGSAGCGGVVALIRTGSATGSWKVVHVRGWGGRRGSGASRVGGTDAGTGQCWRRRGAVARGSGAAVALTTRRVPGVAPGAVVAVLARSRGRQAVGRNGQVRAGATRRRSSVRQLRGSVAGLVLAKEVRRSQSRGGAGVGACVSEGTRPRDSRAVKPVAGVVNGGSGWVATDRVDRGIRSVWGGRGSVGLGLWRWRASC